MNTNQFWSFFSILISIGQRAYTWLTAIQIGPFSLFEWLVGIMFVSVIFAFVHMFAGVSGNGFVTSVAGRGVEAGRFAARDEDSKK